MTSPSIALLLLLGIALASAAAAGNDGLLNWFKLPEKSSVNNATKQTTKNVDSTTAVPTTLKFKGNSGKLSKAAKTSTTTTLKPPEEQKTKKVPVQADQIEKNEKSPELPTSEDQEQSTAIPIPIIFYSDGGYGDYNPLAPNAYQSPYGNYFPPQPYNPYALWKMYPWAEQPLRDLSASAPWSPTFQRPVRSPYPPAPWYPQTSYYYPPPLPPQNSPCSHSSHTSEHNNLNGEKEKHSQHHDHHHTTTTTEKPDGPNPTRISLSLPTQSESVSKEQNEENVPYYPYYQNYDNMYYPQYMGYQQPSYDYQQYAYNNFYQQNPSESIGTVKSKEKRHGHHKRHHKHRSQ